METETKSKAGKLIAYWNAGLDRRECVRTVKGVMESLGYGGCRVTAYSEKFDKPGATGLPATRVRIELPNPTGRYRLLRNGDTVSGLGTIRVAFSKEHGYFGLEDHRKFNEWLEKQTVRSRRDVERLTKRRRFNGVVFESRVSTDAKVRPYRRRQWHPYEGSDHFMYDSCMKGLVEQLTNSIYGIFADMPRRAKRKAGL